MTVEPEPWKSWEDISRVAHRFGRTDGVTDMTTASTGALLRIAKATERLVIVAESIEQRVFGIWAQNAMPKPGERMPRTMGCRERDLQQVADMFISDREKAKGGRRMPADAVNRVADNLMWKMVYRRPLTLPSPKDKMFDSAPSLRKSYARWLAIPEEPE